MELIETKGASYHLLDKGCMEKDGDSWSSSLEIAHVGFYKMEI
jgi:hypothetical protein